MKNPQRAEVQHQGYLISAVNSRDRTRKIIQDMNYV